jgi:hypothetical protein
VSVKQYVVALSVAERAALRRLLVSGVAPARTLARAHVLLKADTGSPGRRLSDAAIADALDLSARTVARVRSDFAAGGMERALRRQPPRRVYARRFDDEREAQLIALACSPPPPERDRWSLRLLADRAVELALVEHACPETIRTVLKKTTSNRG